MRFAFLLPSLSFFLFTTAVTVGAEKPAWLRFDGNPERPGENRHVVFIAGDEEYRSEETCPMLAKILSQTFGFKTTILFPIHPEGGFIDPNHRHNIPGMEQIRSADLVVIGTRFRDLPDEQLQPLAEHLHAGKPIIGFRTATHAFKTASRAGGIDWNNFGPEILGEGWVSHHGKHGVQGARGVINEAHAEHPILAGVGPIFAESDVYGVERVTSDNATILMQGVVTDSLARSSPDTIGVKPQPAAWLRSYTTAQGGKGTAFCTTFGASSDFDDWNLRLLLVNTVFFLCDLVPPEHATNVDYVGAFMPSAFGFNTVPDYYRKLDLKPADYGYGRAPRTGPELYSLLPRPPRESLPNAAEGLPGPAINSTLTTVEAQRRHRTRPRFEQPLEGLAPAATALPLTPTEGEHLVFIGNSLAARMELHGHFESLLHRTFPKARITFRNMGYPGHTPAFRPEAGQPNPWAFPGGGKFRPEIKAHLGKGHYPTPDEWLTILDADTIVAFFGFNESFDGAEGVENFKAELSAFVAHTLSRSYHGDSPPRLVLATPIAVEQHANFLLPDLGTRNELLAAYAEAVLEVAAEKNVGAVDLFTPTTQWFAATKQAPLTINGVHLSDQGYRKLAPLLLDGLFGQEGVPDDNDSPLRKAIAAKSWFWRNDYRMLNGVHAYGRRWAPYGNFNYPEEIEKVRQMTVLRDQAIWQVASGELEAPRIDDSTTRPLTAVQTNYRPNSKSKGVDFLMEKEALEKFTLPKGYRVSVFATEQEFPNLGNPCQMRFDNRGRLWVSTCQSYPHYRPGDPLPDDKLLIYEDIDGDGRADRETVFADGLHLPIGFDFAAGDNGVYLVELPYLTLLRDTDGDGRADSREYLLDGFDPHDTHHAISALDTDHGGGLFLCEGRYLHSQVETPWGPERVTDGGVWRFDPQSWKLERVMQRDLANPWGLTHDAFGQNFLNDASGGRQFWMLGYSVKSPHAHEIQHVGTFNYEHLCRPCSGSEFLHSRHFPDEVQGDYLYANTIGFLGIKQFKVLEHGTEIRGEHRQDLIRSTDGNCRPCDMEVAPDGSLYFIDWHNTLIGHMQHSARDPLRTGDFGRIYRITYPERPLVEPPPIAAATVAQLFQNLRLPELNTRKRSHRELRSRDARSVGDTARTFAAAHSDNEHLVLEALWATWGHQQPNIELLEQCLTAEDHRVRAAAVRVVRHCVHLLENPARQLMRAAIDSHPRVRLEALSAASWLGGLEGAEILLTVASQSTDKWIRNSLNSAILLLRAEAESLLDTGKIDRAAITDGAGALLASELEGAFKKVNYTTKKLPRSLKKDKAFKRTYALGSQVFHEEGSCATCHMETGLGLQSIYPPIAASRWVTDDKQRLIKLVLHGLWGKIEVNGEVYDPSNGVPPMTAMGAMFSDAEVAAVLTYVRTSWGNNASPITPAEVRAVRQATRDRSRFYTPEELLKEHPFE